MSQNNLIVSCHDCGLLQKITHMPEDGTIKCCRCAATLRKKQRVSSEKSIEHTLALVITAIVLFIIANVYPIIQIRAEGHHLQATLLGCVNYLLNNDMQGLSALVFLTTIGAPMLQLAGLLYILFPLHLNIIPPYAAQVYRVVKWVTAWSMLEVLMLGILVSVVKLSALATVVPSIAIWTFALLILLMAAILNDLDIEVIWEQISPQTEVQKINYFADNQHQKSIIDNDHLMNCHNCNLLVPIKKQLHEVPCPRCNTMVHRRKPDSMNRSTALLIAALVLYIPSNILPVMIVSSFGHSEGDTIISGVIYLATYGDLPLAIILFVASIVVPSTKLIILSYLLLSVRFKAKWKAKDRTRLYRLTEIIGRWSMVDVFVVTLMAALIQIQGLMVINVGFGAVAFGAVVVLTMLSAMAFEPRLIWDNMETTNG